MIRFAGFAFAKHLHCAKDAKRQWDRDTRHTPVLLSCSYGVRCGRAAAAAVRWWRCAMEIVPSQLFCVVSLSLLLQSRIRMGDVFLQSEGHQDRELS